MYLQEIKRLGDVVIDIRRGRIEHKSIDEMLYDETSRKLLKHIDNLGYDLDCVQQKERLITDLLGKNLEYRNARQYGICNGDRREAIEHKLLKGKDPRCIGFVCFDDHLLKNDKPKWNELIAQSVQKRAQQPAPRAIFVDFTYCENTISELITIPKAEESVVNTASSITAASSSNINPLSPRNIGSAVGKTPQASPLTNDDTISILLLGETGVGKSTFINAFANYLAFDTLQQAQPEPLVLMSISFLITMGDNFEEKTVTFGVQDDLNNEDYSQLGQSVTQHCRSYLFTLREGVNRGRKLRLIDSPGIGDVRGLAQDDINMQHILLYLSNLSHLNGVCILMKPNNSRLNIFFRSCFLQLFDLLGESARDRIMFCFTNSRSTFYTPGNTGPLVKELLKSLPVQDIPFNKTNTFCFDSESFRYLVAKQNGIKVDQSEEQDYRDSWKKSSDESKRFLQYIGTKAIPSLNPSESTSAKNAQIQIRTLVRPMLEAMRNILRNIVLKDAGSPRTSIELCPIAVEQPTGICFTCPRQYKPAGDFWAVRDALHVLLKRCGTCPCRSEDHLSIDYRLEYRQRADSIDNTDGTMKTMLNDLCRMSARFAIFLTNTADISENDPFSVGIRRMIKEESDIRENKNPCDLNSRLFRELRKLKEDFEDMKKECLAEKARIDLSKIFSTIERMNNHELVKSQVTAAKKWHKFMIKHYECEVPS